MWSLLKKVPLQPFRLVTEELPKKRERENFLGTAQKDASSSFFFFFLTLTTSQMVQNLASEHVLGKTSPSIPDVAL